MAHQRASRKKLVVVGDGMCGKTCLLISYTRHEFNDRYVPTIFESYIADTKVDENRLIKMALWDTAGQEDYELLRPLSYPNTDVLLLCYSINNRDSFENIALKWLPEITQHCQQTPFLLVATKSDLRAPGATPDHTKLVAEEEGVRMAKQIGAYEHLECSAKSRQGVEEVFVTAAMASLGEKRRRRTKKWFDCCHVS